MSGALSELEARIATADPAQESFLFEEAARLLLGENGHDRQIRKWIESRAFAQAAILLHRVALPVHGFQFGELPPGTARTRGLASTWRRGEHRALPFTAATPGLALLRATASAAARQAEARMQEGCETCRGLGWFVTAENDKQICAHRSDRPPGTFHQP